MDNHTLLEILRIHYGLTNISIHFLRKGGSHTYLIEGKAKYLLKVIGAAFTKTSRQSIAVMRYLELHDFPVSKTILSNAGDPFIEISLEEKNYLIFLQEYIDGQEPDLKTRAVEIGTLVAQLHSLLSQYPEKLITQDKQFFIGRYLDFLQKKNYSKLSEYEELGEMLWKRVENQPKINCHGDLHRGNLLEDAKGRIYLLDFDTVCCAPTMFDVMVMCDMTDYFQFKQDDIALTTSVYAQFLTGYTQKAFLSKEEQASFVFWVAIRHFQLQATILEIHGTDCVKEEFIDGQLNWLKKWLKTATAS